jgi:hypothetical protein
MSNARILVSRNKREGRFIGRTVYIAVVVAVYENYAGVTQPVKVRLRERTQ